MGKRNHYLKGCQPKPAFDLTVALFFGALLGATVFFNI